MFRICSSATEGCGSETDCDDARTRDPTGKLCFLLVHNDDRQKRRCLLLGAEGVADLDVLTVLLRSRLRSPGVYCDRCFRALPVLDDLD